MAYTLADKIFSFFGTNAKVRDSYKDGSGKGISERYQEIIGESYDEELSDLVSNLLDNTVVPQTVLEKLIPFLEYNIGNPVIIFYAPSYRRKIIAFAQRIYETKSTIVSYEMLFHILGFDAVEIELFSDGVTFDWGELDDEDRTFDSNSCCVYYTIKLTGTVTISQDVYDAVIRIIEYLEPIDGHLREILYNGTPISVEGGVFDDSFDESFD
jgi:hypothetical protein